MNEEESYDELVVLEQHVVDGDDFVEVEVEPYDDYQPSQEVILLDMNQDDDLLEVA